METALIVTVHTAINTADFIPDSPDGSKFSFKDDDDAWVFVTPEDIKLKTSRVVTIELSPINKKN